MIHSVGMRGAESPEAPVHPRSARAPGLLSPIPSGQGLGIQLPCWPHPAPPASSVTWGQALSPRCLCTGSHLERLSAQVCHHHLIIVTTAVTSVTVIRGRIHVWI